MSRAWLWILQTPFLQHLGPQNFSHDLTGSLKENLKQPELLGNWDVQVKLKSL